MAIEIIVALIMSVGALLTVAFNVYTNVRERNERKARAESETQLTQKQAKQVVAQASQSYTEERIRIETWWKEQFEAVKDENTELAKNMKKTNKRLREVTAYIQGHVPWDELAVAKFKEHGIDMPPVPHLVPADEDDEGV